MNYPEIARVDELSYVDPLETLMQATILDEEEYYDYDDASFGDYLSSSNDF